MAKSTRSKWKKLHRRQRAQGVASAVAKRVERLAGKLHLAAHGGLSAVPMEDPETRFHFVNPVLDPNVPHNCSGRNNNYEAVAREAVDFTKPLRLPAPRTNFYGRSDPNAPHPMTLQYEVVNADAPIAGHALSVEDVQRMESLAQQVNNQTNNTNNNNDNNANEEEVEVKERIQDDNEDGMEEFVLGCNDAAEETSTNTKALLFGGRHSEVKKKSKKAMMTTETAALGSTSAEAKAPKRITSMENPSKKKNRVVQVSGDKKVKRLSNTPNTGLVKSGAKTVKR
ncbi:uncharacterized protein TM35_000351800 [Trypanosoma theileri]|uniref:Uncharacterized protein n=1 Tax=Trypanosoma theileri TaxID=67003 RepID=A0A1X0NL53_9TRYP|nr:uncharacterized protein TM35_000351800 [Trypanosoma theileri]ORC85436.1 hypothetical protein TM35_000351800 [Trypanosoma theileri]